MDIIPLYPPYTGPKPTLLPAIKALPSELREQIWAKLLYFYGWEDKMPEIIIAIRSCSSETALYEELLHIFYRDITFQLTLLNDWQMKGFRKSALKHVRKLEIELYQSSTFPILLTPTSLAEQTEKMLNLEFGHLIMGIDFTRPALLQSFSQLDWRRRKQGPLDVGDLSTWLAAFKSVTSVTITFVITHWKKVKGKGLLDDEISLEEEDVPDWFEDSIKLVEQRIGKKPSRSQPPPPTQLRFCESRNAVLGGGQHYELKFRWIAADGSTMDFSVKKLATEGAATGPSY